LNELEEMGDEVVFRNSSAGANLVGQLFTLDALETDGYTSTPEVGVAENKGSFVSVRFHDFELDLHSGELRKAGCPNVRLPEQSFVILKVLVEHPGKIVSRAEIQQRLWPNGTIVEFEHSIGAAMNRLRQVLGDSAEKPRFIETLPRRGYRWLAEAEWVADGEPGSPSTGSLTTGKPAQRPGRAAEVAEALQALAVPPRIAAILPRDSRRIVAVVPFQFHGVAQEGRFLCSALAETVANRLSKASTLIVRPTATLMKYAGKQVDWAQIAHEMSVDISDLFGLQDRLADSIFDALAPQTQDKILPTPTATARQPLAFELYLRAVDKSLCFNKFETAAAIEMLDRAVELDPGFADAWGMMSTVCWTMGSHFDPDPKWFSKAELAISRTLELDPLNSDAFCTRGLIHFSPSRGFQLAPALRAINAALKINPGRAFARAHRGVVLFHLGFHEASLGDFDEAALANPGFAIAYSARALTALYMGDYEQGERWVEKAQALDPALVFTHISAPLHAIYSGDVGKAWENLRLARNMIPDEPQVAATEALILAHEGQLRRAEELADEAVRSKGSVLHSHHAWHCAAGAYAICGLPDKAIHVLKRCAENGLPNHRAFEADPHFRSLLGHPEFVALMRDIRRGYELLREEFGLSEVYVPNHAKGR
jgi:DNA-binding winged helix-turn-helix (wHTH) protein/tetratricopeptide (TPR) repeat protein